MTDSIFTSQTPTAGNDFNDGNPIVTGTKFRAAVNGTVTHHRFWAPLTGASDFYGYLWSCTSQGAGVLLGTTPQGTGITANTWNTIAYASPIAITAGAIVMSVTYSGSGHYVASSSFFGSALFNGNLEAIADNTSSLRNGSYDYDPAGPTSKYPTQFFSAGCYFADVVFAPSAAFDPKVASSFMEFF